MTVGTSVLRPRSSSGSRNRVSHFPAVRRTGSNSAGRRQRCQPQPASRQSSQPSAAPPAASPADLARRAASHGRRYQAFSRAANSANRARSAWPESVVNDFTCSSICTCVRESKLTIRRYQSTRRLSRRADQLLSWACRTVRLLFSCATATAPGVGSTRRHPALPSKISTQACASEFRTM